MRDVDFVPVCPLGLRGKLKNHEMNIKSPTDLPHSVQTFLIVPSRPPHSLHLPTTSLFVPCFYAQPWAFPPPVFSYKLLGVGAFCL